jgi:hypothetical protein
MIVTIGVLRYRRDPNSVKSHALNIVKVVLNTLESTTTIMVKVVTAGRIPIRSGVPVR